MKSLGKKVLVVGATGGSGKAAVQRLLAAGHEVTAFSRHADRLAIESDRLTLISGDATDIAQVRAAVAGQDAVIVTLGISENPLRVRLLGSRTQIDVRSRGTRTVIAAMKEQGVRRLVVQSSYGVGETHGRLPLLERVVFSLLLKPQIADTERQEQAVRESGLDWTLAQPVTLTNAAEDGDAFVSPEGDTRSMKIARWRVARFLVNALEDPAYVGRSFALSSP